jgi:hypothetical protein
MAANVTERLADGLAKIETIRVSAPSTTAQGSGARRRTSRCRANCARASGHGTSAHA